MTVDLSTTGGVATLTLDRLEKRNALNLEFATDIARALDEAAASASILVLRSSGPVFSAGVDLSELKKGGGSVKCCTAELRA